MILPLVDLVMSVVPFKFTTLVWRFGALGLFASAVSAPILVLFLIYALANTVGDRKIMIACGVIAALLTILLLGGMGSFALDALQMKSRIPAARVTQLYTASAQAMLKLALQSVASLVLAISIFRTLRDPKLAPAKAIRNPAANLLVGRSIPNRPIERADPGAALSAGDSRTGPAATPATSDE